MDSFLNVLGPVVAVCTGVMLLTLFFTLVRRLPPSRRDSAFEIVSLKGIVARGSLVAVHLAGGKILTEVRFIGFTRAGSGTSVVPHQLAIMLALESIDGRRIFVRADTIRMIEEIVMPA